MPTTPPLLGAGNVWFGDVDPGNPDKLLDKLEATVELGLDAVRVAATGPLRSDDPTEALEMFQVAAAIVFECGQRGLKVLFAFLTETPGDHDEGWYYQRGRQWGDWLRSRPDLAPSVVGFSIQNEWSLEAQRVYNGVLNGGGTPDQAASAAMAEAKLHIAVINGFCRGIRDTYPAAWRVPSGLHNPPWGLMQRNCLEWLANTGAFGGTTERPPILTAVGVHPYRNRNHFEITWDQGHPIVTPDGWSFSPKMDELLSFAGLPSSMALFAQEFNVQQDTFGWQVSVPPDQQVEAFEAAKAAMRVLMEEILSDDRVRYAAVYTPWTNGDGPRYLVSIDYRFTPTPDTITPSGVAVSRWAPP